MIQTAENIPQHFWYFNNGITAICEEYDKQPIGGDSTETGVFKIRRISVINGAQTIGSLARAKANGAPLERARVQIRIISLDGTPDGFSVSVTNANNTQNDLSPVDFVAADETQERIRKEAASMGLIYTFRRGDTEPESDAGFDIRSATIAAACASGDLRIAVASKRYISGLWENTTKEPYTKLFNHNTRASYLWYIVRIMRAVDNCLIEISNSLSGKDKLVAVHGNRFILYYLFEEFKKIGLFEQHNFEKDAPSIKSMVGNVLERIIKKVPELFPEAYPGNIFKNNERQQQILSAIATT
ncbi:MAG: AIPR family protein [Acidiphilium sp.]